MAVLPLAECHLAVGPVGIDCGRNAPGLAVDLTPFYYSSGDFYRVRVGSWYWQLEIY